MTEETTLVQAQPEEASAQAQSITQVRENLVKRIEELAPIAVEAQRLQAALDALNASDEELVLYTYEEVEPRTRKRRR